jgi:hypothetical protein
MIEKTGLLSFRQYQESSKESGGSSESTDAREMKRRRIRDLVKSIVHERLVKSGLK